MRKEEIQRVCTLFTLIIAFFSNQWSCYCVRIDMQSILNYQGRIALSSFQWSERSKDKMGSLYYISHSFHLFFFSFSFVMLFPHLVFFNTMACKYFPMIPSHLRMNCQIPFPLQYISSIGPGFQGVQDVGQETSGHPNCCVMSTAEAVAMFGGIVALQKSLTLFLSLNNYEQTELFALTHSL